MNIADITDKIVSLAEKSGATQAEVYAIRVKTISTYVDDDIPKIGSSIIESGVGLKYIIGKRIGFTSSTLSQETPQDVVERAKSIARVSNEDLKFISLPEPKKVSSSPEKYYDDATAAADSMSGSWRRRRDA